MSFALKRCELRVTFGAVAFAAVCIVAGQTQTLLLVVLSLAVHETAHAIAAKNLGLSVARITVYPFGAVMQLFGMPEKGEWTVAAAGPLASLTFAALLRLSALFLPQGERMERLIGINLSIAAVNLLPAFPLDGGRIFRDLLRRCVRERTARTLLLSFTALIALGMTGAGVYLMIKGIPAWTLFAIPPFLVVSAFGEWRMPDAGIVSHVMERRSALRSGTAEKAQLVVLPEHASVGQALSALSGTRYTILRVLGENGFCELDEGRILDAAARYGTQTPLKSVISRLTDGK